ncbi:MAG: hypothetical protein KAH54_00650 [Candidatus Sabulitectum sp.]|nr:hypothetical protein [Candidatus Sabulitectum sp.]
MKKALIILLILTALVAAEGFKRHALTVSAGIPGLLIPELAYEYSIDASNKIGVAAGTFVFWTEYRLNYVRMVNSFELMGSLGYVPDNDGDDDDDGMFDDMFESILSGGTSGAKFVSATGGYRYTADGGFIFRAVGGGGYFFNDDDSRFIPFFQIGIGYGF